MMPDFSKWYHWPNRNDYPGIDCSGVYVVAICEGDISDTAFSMLEEVVYVGMTISALRNRLDYFDKTISPVSIRRSRHGGADRFLYKHPDYEKLVKQLYVALCHLKFDPWGRTPSNLRAMGRVRALEYEMMAQYAEQWGDRPEFNRRDSKKFGSIPGNV
jgi:hypothetical protein